MGSIFPRRSRALLGLLLLLAAVAGLAAAIPGLLPPASQAFHASSGIGGYVYAYASSTPVPAATVKYCSASSWTALDSCTPQLLTNASALGEWQLVSVDPNLYYRFWAVTPDGYYGQSNSVSGSNVGTGHLILYLPDTLASRGTLTVQK